MKGNKFNKGWDSTSRLQKRGEKGLAETTYGYLAAS